MIVALYEDYGIADRVRTQLVADGFATDRVEATSAVTVHPRAEYEISSARRILAQNRSLKVEELLS
jgi:hypothetical protein